MHIAYSHPTPIAMHNKTWRRPAKDASTSIKLLYCSTRLLQVVFSPASLRSITRLGLVYESHRSPQLQCLPVHYGTPEAIHKDLVAIIA